MWLFYGYKILLPLLIGGIVLYLYIRLIETRIHHGWWTAFLIFSITLALTIPFKTNPFQQNLNTYKASEMIVEQMGALTTRPFFSNPKLKENVSEQDIKKLEEQLPKVAKHTQEKAQRYLDEAWQAYSVQQTVKFFVAEMNYDNEQTYQLLSLDKINLDKLEYAHESVDKLPECKEKNALISYLQLIEDGM